MSRAEDSSYGTYTSVAIVLHWAIAAAILSMLVVGWWMADAIDSDDEQTRFLAYQAIQLHKAGGLTILVLSVARLVWRLLNPPPPLPEGMPGWQRFASDFSHFCLYGLMIGAPLTGWAMVSSSPEFSSLPTSWFGVFTAPHLPIAEWFALAGLSAKETSDLAHAGHEWIVFLGALLLAAHVAAALKHHYVDQDQVLARMTPGVSPRRPVIEGPAPRAGGLAKGLAGGVALASIAGAALLFGLPGRGGETAAVVPAAVEAPAPPAAAADPAVWTPIPGESAFVFKGKHLGSEFKGVFEQWSAEIRFDPADLAASRARVTVDVASAKTGDSQYDGALPQADWFDAAGHPEAVFETTAIETADGGGYRAAANLTIKGRTNEIALPFEVAIEGDRAEMTGAVTLDRFDFGLGQAADPDAAYVAREVVVELTVVARRGAP